MHTAVRSGRDINVKVLLEKRDDVLMVEGIAAAQCYISHQIGGRYTTVRGYY